MHVSTPGGRDGYGMLVGRLYRCPASDTSYVAVEDAHPSPYAMPGSDDHGNFSRFREFWLSISMKAGQEERELVGWYHAHSRLGVSLSRSDERLHNAHFPNRWQCALVLTSDPVMPEGGFFQRDPRTGAFESTPAPFYEIISGKGFNGGRIRTWSGWCNYKPDRSVATSRGRRQEAAFELVPMDTDGSVAVGVEPGPPSAEQTNGNTGRATRVEDSAEAGGAPAPTVLLPQLLEAGRARRRRRRILRLTAAAASVLLAAGGLVYADMSGRIDLGEMTEDVSARSRALTRTLAHTLLPSPGGTADGQAGAVPRARGQGPGAPSADSRMGLARPASQGGVLLDEIQEYGRIRASADDDRPVNCEQLRAAYDRIESTARLDVAARSTRGLALALEEVRRDFRASGCRAAD